MLSLADIACLRIPFSFGVLSFFGENCMNWVVSEILIWSTLPKLRTYDIDVNFTGLRISYDRPNFCYHAELHLPIAYQIILMQQTSLYPMALSKLPS